MSRIIKDESTTSFWWVYIIFGIFCYYIWDKSHSGISPLAKHGRDTILYHDTAYVIRFKIDTAIYIDPNPDGETLERP